jgi:hypothetical protein
MATTDAYARYLTESSKVGGTGQDSTVSSYDAPNTTAGGYSYTSRGGSYPQNNVGANYAGGQGGYDPYQSDYRSAAPTTAQYLPGSNYRALTGANAYTPYQSQYRSAGPGEEGYQVGDNYGGVQGEVYTPYETEYRRAYSTGMAAPDLSVAPTSDMYGQFMAREYAGLQPITDEQGRTQYDISREQIRADAARQLADESRKLSEQLASAGMGKSGLAFQQQRALSRDVERETGRAIGEVTTNELAAYETRAERLGQQAFESSERGRELSNDAWKFSSQQDYDAWAKEQDIASEDADRAWKSVEAERDRQFTSSEKGRELTQDAHQFSTEAEYKTWAREQDIADAESEMAWNAVENERKRSFESSEHGRDLIEQAWEFKTEADYKKWAREQDIADAESEMAWKSMESDRQRVFESTERGRELVQEAWKFRTQADFEKWAKEQDLGQADVERAWKAVENQLERENRLDQIVSNTVSKLTTMEFEDQVAAQAAEREARMKYYNLVGASGEELGVSELADLKSRDPGAYYAYVGGQAGKDYQTVQSEEALRLNYLDTLLAAAFDEPGTTLALEEVALRYGIAMPTEYGYTGSNNTGTGQAGTGAGTTPAGTSGTGTTPPAGSSGPSGSGVTPGAGTAQIPGQNIARASWGDTKLNESSAETGLSGWKAQAAQQWDYTSPEEFDKYIEVIKILPDGSVQWKYRTQDQGEFQTGFNPQGETYKRLLETSPEWNPGYDYNSNIFKKEKGWYFNNLPTMGTYFKVGDKVFYRSDTAGTQFLDYPDTESVSITDVATGQSFSISAKNIAGHNDYDDDPGNPVNDFVRK